MTLNQSNAIDPLTRIFISNIPTHTNESTLRKNFERFGGIEVYICVNGRDDNGWAFIGYNSRDGIRKLLLTLRNNIKHRQTMKELTGE